MSGPLLALLWHGLLSVPPCSEARQRALEVRTAIGRDALTQESALQFALRDYGAGLLAPSEAALRPHEQLQRVADRIESLCRLLERPTSTPPVPDRARLAAILDQPEFSAARQRHTDWLDRIVDWVKRLAEGLFESEGAVTYSNIARAAILGAALLISLVLGLRLFRPAGTARRHGPRTPSDAALLLEEPATHLQRAREALPGEPREAIREGLFALLSALELKRWARPDRVKTNRELAGELGVRGAPPEVEMAARSLLDWYDRTFYSLAPIELDAARHFLDEVEALRRRIPGPPS